MKIKDIELGAFPVMLAPMEGITDQSFRKICKRMGADVLFTEFIAADGLIRDVEKSHAKLRIDDTERPVAIQIFGNNSESLSLAAKMAEQAHPDFIDINWGCPVKKIASKGAGSGILNDIPKMISITKAVVDSVNIPVTVKTRLGYDDTSKPIVDIAERLQDIGVAAISIHGRTRAQMYKGEADWTLIGAVKNNPRMKIPIFGNGDITSAQKALEYKNKYGIDGILIGRAAIGNPWIFKDVQNSIQKEQSIIQYEKSTCSPCSTIENSERISICREHLLNSVTAKGERTAILEMRPFYSGYFKGIANFKPTRMRLVMANDLNEILEILDTISTFDIN